MTQQTQLDPARHVQSLQRQVAQLSVQNAALEAMVEQLQGTIAESTEEAKKPAKRGRPKGKSVKIPAGEEGDKDANGDHDRTRATSS